MRRFCGFRSLWRTFRLWQKARPFNSWYMNDCKERGGGVLERKHLTVADISMAITGCSCSTRCSWWNFSLAIPGCFTLPSQFQDLDLHCSCQNTSSSPADDKSHTLAREGIHWNIWCVLGWLYLTWSQYSKTRVNFLSLCKTSCSLEETEQL